MMQAPSGISTPARQHVASSAELAAWVRDARQRTIDLVADLTDEQLMGPRLAIINPFLWEIGHVAWFQEKWVLRGVAGEPPIRADGDSLYDSAAIPHDTRWDLPLPLRQETLAYMRAVRDRVIERIERVELRDNELYFIRLSVFHEDMHTEAFTYTRQTLAYPPPSFRIGATSVMSSGAKRAGAGGRAPRPSIRFTGSAMAAGGCGATSTAGFLSSRTAR